MRACRKCGHANQMDARYCSACGEILDEVDRSTTGSLPVVEVEPSITVEEEPVPPGGALLLAHIGPEAGSWFALERDETTIGRHPDSDIVLNDVTVSRRHAVIKRAEGHYHLQDVASLNGTYVDRTRIEDAELSHGNEIQIGKFRFLFVHPSANEEGAP